MPDPAPRSLLNIDQTLIRSVEHVFRTMVRQPATLSETTTTYDGSRLGHQDQVIASVGFVGVASGLLYLRMAEPFARVIAGQVLKMSELELIAEGPDTVKDAIGELTNMLAGTFKNTLCDLGYRCRLTLPTIVRGDHVNITAVKEASRQVFYFEAMGKPFVVDLQVKIE